MPLLLRKLALLAVLVFLLLWGAGEAFRRVVPWQSAQNPRARLLWDAGYDGSSVVLLGDSIFCSFYVDRPGQTLWSQLERKLNGKVFPGALNGAKPADFLAGAQRIARSWPRETVVVVDLSPTRFVRTKRPLGEANYRKYFSSPAGDASFWERLKSGGVDLLKDRLFLLSNRFAVEEYLKSPLRRPEFFRTGDYRDRTWNRDGAFARNNYRVFSELALLDPEAADLSFLDQLQRVFRESGLKGVVVLTPLNSGLIQSYADPRTAQRQLDFLDRLHDRVVSRLKRNGTEYLDLYRSAPAEGFADMIHTNALGDERVAEALAAWLKTNRTITVSGAPVAATGR